MRVTNSMLTGRFLFNLQNVLSRMEREQEILSSGQRIHRPSDDPPGTYKAMRFSTEVNDTQQRVKNAEQAVSFMNITDSALSQALLSLHRVRELTIYGASDTVPQQSRDALATEVDQALNELIQVGNTKVGDRYIFGGDRTLTAPFTTTVDPITGLITAVDYVGTGPIETPGNPGLLTVELGDGVRVATNVTGDVALLDAMNAAIQVRNDLQSGNTANLTGPDIAQVDNAMDQLLRYQADLGARTNRVETILQRLQLTDVRLQDVFSKTIDADIPKTIVELKQDENVYRLALASGARVIQPSLLDFLR